VLDLLLPQRCLACGRSGAVVCAACLDALPRLAPPLCERCGALQPPAPGRCQFCGATTRTTELGEAMVGRVLASGGEVSMVDRHGGLTDRDGVGAILRYAA